MPNDGEWEKNSTRKNFVVPDSDRPRNASVYRFAETLKTKTTNVQRTSGCVPVHVNVCYCARVIYVRVSEAVAATAEDTPVARGSVRW